MSKSIPYKELPHDDLLKGETIEKYTTEEGGPWLVAVAIKEFTSGNSIIHSIITNRGRRWDCINRIWEHEDRRVNSGRRLSRRRSREERRRP